MISGRRALGRAVVPALASVLAAGSSSASATPPDAELVTVTDAGFVATWTTAAPSDTTVCFGPVGEAQRCERQESATRFHYAEVEGLQPGVRYAYLLRSDGLPQAASATNPGTFTTLVPPPGRHLFDFAVVSDVHIGEKCSGTAVTLPAAGSVPPCFKTEEGEPGHPYASTMARAAVDEVNSRNVQIAILNGDNTSHAEYDEVAALRDIFGGLNVRWYPARGAHDRANQTPEETRCGSDKDCFRHLLFPTRPSGQIFYSFDHGGYNFVVLDSANPGSGSGEISQAQLQFLRSDLDRARRHGRKSFIFFHHPVTEYANTTAVPPVIFGVTPEQGGREFLEEVGRHPEVVGVITSHTHRNYVSYSPSSGVETVFAENGPTKEYPGGYSVLRVYTGGYMRNFHRLRCEFCRQWTSITRDEYFGLYPQYTLGTLSARNFTHVYGCRAPTPPPSPPFGNESATGGDTARSVCPSATDPGSPSPGGDGDAGGEGGGNREEDERETGGDRADSRPREVTDRDRSDEAAGAASPDGSDGELPFTGLSLALLLLAGAVLVSGGVIGRRGAR